MIRFVLALLLVCIIATPVSAKFDALPNIEQSLTPQVDTLAELGKMYEGFKAIAEPIAEEIAAAVWRWQYGPRGPPNP
jgi:hypothetical protein